MSTHAQRYPTDCRRGFGAKLWRIVRTLCLLVLAEIGFASCSNKPPACERREIFVPGEAASLARTVLDDTRLDQVQELALNTVRGGLTAGSVYPQIWIRDLNSFIEAALVAQPAEPLRAGLLRIAAAQERDRNIPDGVSLTNGRASKSTVETDQESSLIQAVAKYIASTGDTDVLREVVEG
jgi:hypothetical protein